MSARRRRPAPGMDGLRIPCSGPGHASTKPREWWLGYSEGVRERVAAADLPPVPAGLVEVVEQASRLKAAVFEVLLRSAELSEAVDRAGGASAGGAA